MAYMGGAVSSSQIGVTDLNPSRCERDGFKLPGLALSTAPAFFFEKGAKAL
ncbi:hypothetical protein GCM10008023_38740 [Sphingomonas glacialis]|uniref:Uncharacterized protein n=1 Tax=Sphingomonas glacialis TaxID=658225 RepID=A0ABQ3LVQ6_9SPHN|nr:hypothetical protein GCM10008023_38740 [Sphingomonas glacialis]